MTPAKEVIHAGPVQIRYLLESADTGGALVAFEAMIPTTARVPVLHSHDDFDETLYGLTGTVTWTLDGRQVPVGPGQVLFIPRGHVHGFMNLETEDARQLSVVTPGLLSPEYFRQIGDVLNVGGPPNVERVIEVMLRHGLRPVAQKP